MPILQRAFVAFVVCVSTVAFTPAAAAMTPASVAMATSCAIGSPAPGFADAVSSSQNHAQVWRLYQAVFLRQPDDEGLAYWVGAKAQGQSLEAIAFSFTSGPEFQNRYGDIDHASFVRLVYLNVLCRIPDAEGERYWVSELESGAIDRPRMLVNFTELREYLRRTSTCYSVFPGEAAATDHCARIEPVPLASASFEVNGYQAMNASYRRPNGSTGSLQGVVADLDRVLEGGLVKTGSDRCSVASINANWLVASEKDGPNPAVLGLGVVAGAAIGSPGVAAKGSSERSDRGVFGLRVDPSPKSVVEVWPGDTLSDDDTRLNSVIAQRQGFVLESWHAAAELSPYLSNLEPEQAVGSGEWLWAAAGIPLRIDGQTDADFGSDYANDPYTYATLRHTFVAADHDGGRLVFGGTADLDVRDLLAWATATGYEDLIKFDGGGSAEYNVGGEAVVAGTPRDVPVWIGIGC